MLGTIVNTLAVLAGSILGLLLTAVTKKFGMKVSERFSERIMQALGLCTIYIGISGSLEGENTLVLILSMVIGTLIGEALISMRRSTVWGIFWKRNSKGFGVRGKERDCRRVCERIPSVLRGGDDHCRLFAKRPDRAA